jgi:EmrB/QacA subfamily drug resistance transporter
VYERSRSSYARPVSSLSLDTRRRLTLAATILGSSLAFIDATVVIVALPTIEEDLGLGLSGQQWVFLAYSVTLAALYLVGGAIGDRYGRRRAFVLGAFAFALTSALAGAAPTGELLIAARALQGVAAAFVTTNSLALLRGVYGADAGRAVGLWTSFTSLATVAGPPLGGALVQWTSWRWIFFVNLPLAGAAVVLARVGRCEEQRAERLGRLDLGGAGLIALGLAALTYGLVEGAERGFGATWWALVLAAGALAAFVVVERRVAEPMLPFALFRHRNFAMANLETFFAYGAIYGFIVYFTLYVQFLGFTPFQAGLVNVPVSALLILLAARFGALADRHGPRLFLALGPALIGGGTLLVLLVDSRSRFWSAGIAGLLLFSLGLAILVAPITAAALKSAPTANAGVASGVNSTVSRLGSLLAVALIGLTISLVFSARADEGDAVPLARGQERAELRAASVDGFRAGMGIAAALALAAAAVGAVGIRNERAPAPGPSAAPAGS